jgi:hypothetical protein
MNGKVPSSYPKRRTEVTYLVVGEFKPSQVDLLKTIAIRRLGPTKLGAISAILDRV